MADETHRVAERGPSHQAVEVGVALLTLAFGVLVLSGSLRVGIDWGLEGPRPGFFPFYISLFIIVGSIVNIVQVVTGSDGKPGIFSSWEQLWQVTSVVLPLIGYVLLVLLGGQVVQVPLVGDVMLVPFGMYIASVLLIAVFMFWLGRYSIWLTLPVAFGIPLVIYIVFERYFQISLPKGPVEYWVEPWIGSILTTIGL